MDGNTFSPPVLIIRWPRSLGRLTRGLGQVVPGSMGPCATQLALVGAGDAGHDYSTIERQGFRKLVVERDGQPAIIANPR